MTSPTPQPERRRAARALADFPIRFSEDDEQEPAILRDISEIGLACTSPREVPEMTLVALDFSLPGSSAIHHVKGAVVRCEPMPKGRYDMAVYFTETSAETRLALAGYVTSAHPAP
ncbi:MAG: PilZ domain-containing protein [Planctomycetes bacterium]|nr:PilZ domain-containing protein [Planctomycetota bacterium]